MRTVSPDRTVSTGARSRGYQPQTTFSGVDRTKWSGSASWAGTGPAAENTTAARNATNRMRMCGCMTLSIARAGKPQRGCDAARRRRSGQAFGASTVERLQWHESWTDGAKEDGVQRRGYGWGAAALLTAAGLLAATGAAAQESHAGEYAQADINYGMQVYGETCVACHGPDGDVVDGVSFRTGQFRSAGSDQDLMRIISAGIPDTAMPPGDYTASELTGLVAYLRTMGDFDPGDVTVGDVTGGEVIYRGKGDCASCHRIGREGSRIAPDLTDVGAVRTAGSLAESLVDPTSAMLPRNRSIRAVGNDGTLYTGRRLNEDTYTVQIIDENERLVSLVKEDLSEFTVITTSPMPSYAETLTDQERADVLAFLLTLKGMNR